MPPQRATRRLGRAMPAIRSNARLRSITGVLRQTTRAFAGRSEQLQRRFNVAGLAGRRSRGPTINTNGV